jgi:hypothetical protein
VDVDLGIQVQEGKWYGIETDLDATDGILHGVVTDIASGHVLADEMAFLTDPKYAFAGGTYHPDVDGAFNAEAYIDGEHTLLHSIDLSLTRPRLAVIDTIDAVKHQPGSAFGLGGVRITAAMLRGGIALCPTTDDGPQAVLPQAMHDTEILGMVI